MSQTVRSQYLQTATPQISSDLQLTLSELEGSISEDVKEQFAHGNESLNHSRIFSDLHHSERYRSGFISDNLFDNDDLNMFDDFSVPVINKSQPIMHQTSENKLSLMALDGSTSQLNLKFNDITSLSYDQNRTADNYATVGPQQLSILDISGHLQNDDIISTMMTDTEPSIHPGARGLLEISSLDEIEGESLRALQLFSQCHSILLPRVSPTALPSTPQSALEVVEVLEEACHQQIDSLNRLKQQSFSQQVVALKELQQIIQRLHQERNTWKLIEYLHDELTSGPNTGTPTTTEANNTSTESGKTSHFISEKSLVEHLRQTDSQVKRYSAVVRWLEDLAFEKLPQSLSKISHLSQNVCFENTLLELKNAALSGHPLPEKLVTELDPDAPIRQGKQLSDLDQKDELALSQKLWTYTRTGRLEMAIDVLVKCGQPIRSILFLGGQYYHDPNLVQAPEDLDNIQPIQGNTRRDLWKNIVWKMSEEPRFNLYDRAIHGVLCGNLEAILPACSSWEDWLWACFKVMLDIYIEGEIRTTPHTRRDKELVDMPSNYWLQNLQSDSIFSDLQACRAEGVKKYANSQFGLIQDHLITGNIEELINTMHGWVSATKNSEEEAVPVRPGAHLLRFMSHLVIYCRDIGLSVDDDKCNDILSYYIQELIRLNKEDLIAPYTASITDADRQVLSYAGMLQNISQSNQQRIYLDLARQVGLNTLMITKRMVETVRGETEQLTRMNNDVTLNNTTEDITSLDQKKINVMDWLVYEEDQLLEALTQGLGLIRFFLASRKFSAADQVFKKLPENILQILINRWKHAEGDKPLPLMFDNLIKEFLCVQSYIEAMDAWNQWFNQFHRDKPEEPEIPTQFDQNQFSASVAYEQKKREHISALTNWYTTLYNYLYLAQDKINKVLLFDGGWMVDRHEDESLSEGRREQLEIIRRVCLPTLCFLFQSMLKQSDRHLQCLNFSIQVTSEDYQLYALFSREELQRLLTHFKESAQLLAKNKDTDYVGYPI